MTVTTAPILVTGGTGTLGRHVVPLLREAGRTVRVLSRHGRESGDGIAYVTADLFRDEGIEAAVDGVEIVLHLAGGPKGDDVATENLVRAASAAGVKHLVYVSVIGSDTLPLAWLRSKLNAERAIAGSGIPWTTLRAAQFHDLALTVVEKTAKLPVIPVPGGLRLQPVDAREVAARLVHLTLGEPAGLVPDLAGPKVYGIAELSRGYLKARGKQRLMMPVRMPGKAGRAYRAGENLSLDGADVGRRTWEDFLTERVGRPACTGEGNPAAHTETRSNP
ncbi:SDR family oxidoreductase [Streptomyces sp. NBC_00829]|uniref:SDR family oxidoreductase n=1 Tax=Streptomyces sp. NBC_00829 TaxID=2903679 RepID=UPI00386BB3D6|nr:SDR family oxidoreductase [Streptomyces sp. NBC_00829]